MKHLPPAAAPHPRVRVVLPSGALRDADRPAFDDGIARLQAADFDVRFDERRARDQWRGYYAGDDATRATALIAALEEPDVDIVWWGRGGSGCARILPAVIAAARAIRPRILIGFSDATALLNAFAVQLGWVTFHGPAITSIARADLDRLRATVCGEACAAPIIGDRPPAGSPIGPLEGRVFGGNLTVLTTLLGTPAQPPSSQTLWLLEDVNEPAYRVDRALRHLRDAGGTRGAAGAWCGPLHPPSDDASCRAGSAVDPPEAALESAMRASADLDLPCVPGFPGGHRGEMHLVPIGARVRLDPQAGWMTGTHPWVSARGQTHV